MRLIETAEQQIMFEVGRLKVENTSLLYQLEQAIKRIQELEASEEAKTTAKKK